MDLPEAGERGRQLEMSAEALEARLVAEPFDDQVDELGDRLGAGVAQLETFALAAFAAGDVDVQGGQGLTRCGVYRSRGS